MRIVHDAFLWHLQTEQADNDRAWKEGHSQPWPLLVETGSPGSQKAGAFCTDATQLRHGSAAGNLLAEVWDSCCDRHRQAGDEQGFALNRNGLAICLHTLDVERYGFGHVVLCFLDSGSESMAAGQSRHIGVKRILVRLYDDRELVNRHLHPLRKATSRLLTVL